MKYKLKNAGTTVNLTNDHFRAKGGEGSIYVLKGVAYKVCETGKMVDIRKLVELATLDHPKIIRPEDVLLDAKDTPVGYTMKLVPGNAKPLAAILSKTYREREGLTPDRMGRLVEQIVDGIRYIHSKPGYLQVDGNEFNYMVTDTHEDVYFIDVNSYQTPNFPADAIMPSIRDWSCGTNFTQLSDCYSAGIVTFYMFTGIHPFKHRHPKYPDIKTAMTEQMKAGVSVFDQDASFPHAAVYFPFDQVIPGGKDGAYMQWYRAMFERGQRLYIPLSFQATITFAAIVKEVVGSNNFEIVKLREYGSQVTGYLFKNGREVVTTTDGLYLDNQPSVKTSGKFRVGFSPKNTPVFMTLDNGKIRVANIETGKLIPSEKSPFEIEATDIMSCDGRLFWQYDKNVFELQFMENADGSMWAVVPSVAAGVLPNATRMFQGVVFQNTFGAVHASMFPEKGHHRQFRIKELEGMEITDAKYEDHVLMAIAADRVEGVYTRFVFRFSSDWSNYDTRRFDDITPTGINFTVLPNGIVVSINEDESLEIFNRKGPLNVKVYKDPAIKADMRLCHSGQQVRFAHGKSMYSIKVK